MIQLVEKVNSLCRKSEKKFVSGGAGIELQHEKALMKKVYKKYIIIAFP